MFLQQMITQIGSDKPEIFDEVLAEIKTSDQQSTASTTNATEPDSDDEVTNADGNKKVHAQKDQVSLSKPKHSFQILGLLCQ